MTERVRIDWRRVLLVAVVIALGCVLAWKAQERDYFRQAGKTDPAALPSKAVFAMEGPDGWFALRMFHNSHAGWLREDCQERSAETYVVESMPGNRPAPVNRDARIEIWGERARIVFRSHARLGGGEPWAREATMDTTGIQRLHSLLQNAGYPAEMAPTDGNFGCVDTGTVLIQSCHAGHYYGVARGCGHTPVHDLVEDVLDFAEAGTAQGRPVAVPAREGTP